MPKFAKQFELQKELARRVITTDSYEKIRTVCGVDVSYKGKAAYAAAVLVDAATLEITERATTETRIIYPYIPGLLMLREANPVISAINSLKGDFDLLMVDGNGRLHPRMCGLACYLGIILDKPTIGVAKSLLCGSIWGHYVMLHGEVAGGLIECDNKKIYVSIGNRISLETAMKLTESLIKRRERSPEPLRMADKYSKERAKNNHP